MSKKYMLVEFLSSRRREYDIISTIWYNEDEETCYWPPNTSKAAEYAKSHHSVGKSWKTYPVKVLYTSASYNEAFKKTEDAETLSDIASDVEQVQKRRRVQTARIPDSETDYSDEEPTPVPDPFQTPRSTTAPVQPTPAIQPSIPTTSYQQGGNELVRHMLKKLEEVLESQKRLEQSVRNLQAQHDKPAEDDELDIQLKLTTLEELAELDQMLNDSAAQKTLVNKFRQLGGDSERNIVRAMLAETLDVSLQRALNWSGGGSLGKTAFRKHQRLISVMKKAARKHQKAAGLDDSSFSSYAVNFFNGAVDRNGGRNIRAKLSAAKKARCIPDVVEDVAE